MRMLRIVVCAKQVLDPELPPSAFAIRADGKGVEPPEGSPPVISPYDENALEAALRIKDEQECEITVISLGAHLAKPVLRKTLAAGADHLVLVQDERLEEAGSLITAHALAAAIRKLPGYDLVLCGRQASDTNAGLVGIGLSELLELPLLPLASSLWISGGTVSARCEIPAGIAEFQAELPAAATVTSEAGDLRMATVKASIAAKKKKPQVMNLDDLDDLGDLGVAPSDLLPGELAGLEKSPARAGKCMIIREEDPAAAGRQLADALKAQNLLSVPSA